MPTYRLSTPVETATPEDLFAWHERPGAFHRLNPPWDPVTVLSRTGSGLDVGARIELETRVGPVPVRWVSEHTACERPHGFTDEQRNGPFSRWRHHHRFLEQDGRTILEDEIEWAAPAGALGAAVGGVQQRLERAFRFRHRRTLDDLGRHAPYRDRSRLRVGISGATGLVGTALSAFLDAGGHDVVPLRRAEGRLVLEGVGRLDAVVHLAGAPIAEERWDDDGKQRLRASRVDLTRRLCEDLAARDERPAVLVSGSAVGFYGDGGDRVLAEGAGAGDNFLAEVARAWEDATAPARSSGIRVVTLRTGIVLSASGGYLGQMLPLFRAGAGGPQGTGAQYLPWIHLDDEIGLVHEALMDDRYEGSLNATAPVPVPQREFAKALGRVLHRPAIAPAPAMALRLVLGRQKADELVLSGQRAVPSKALELGYRFTHPDLEQALAFELGLAG